MMSKFKGTFIRLALSFLNFVKNVIIVGLLVLVGVGVGFGLAIETGVKTTPSSIVARDNTTHIYLGNVISNETITVEVLEKIRSAKKGDKIVIHLAGYGGYLHDGLILLIAIDSSKADITMQVDGPVYSMHAILACAGDNVVVADGATLMYHDYSGGFGGKSIEIKTAIAATEYVYEKMTDRCIDRGILAPLDVFILKLGVDLYLTGEEVNERIQKKKTADERGQGTKQEAQSSEEEREVTDQIKQHRL